MYDIYRDSWTICPSRLVNGANHSSICLNGKLFIFFGSQGVNHGDYNSLKSIERLDAQAFIEGKSVEWMLIKLPPQ